MLQKLHTNLGGWVYHLLSFFYLSSSNQPTKNGRGHMPPTVWSHVVSINASETFETDAVLSLGLRMRLPLPVFNSGLILISDQVLSCNFNTKYDVSTWTNFIIAWNTPRIEAASFSETSVELSANMASHPAIVQSSYSIHYFYTILHTKFEEYTPIWDATCDFWKDINLLAPELFFLF